MRLLQGPHKAAAAEVFLLLQHPNYSRKRMMPSGAPQMALHVEAEEVEAVPVSGNAVAYNTFEFLNPPKCFFNHLE